MVVVTVIIVVVVLVALFLIWLRYFRHTQVGAVLTPAGFQEANIVINGRYRPDTLKLNQGVPTRLSFIRKEDNPCSERLIFSAFGIDRRLPAFQETTVEFIPATTGTFLFTCQWGMYRGKLIVTKPGGRMRAALSAGKSKISGRDQR